MIATISDENDTVQLEKFSILIVEDDEQLNRLYQKHLRGKHFVRGAHSVAEARHLLTLYAPDLVILDLNLGDGDGADIVALLKHPLLENVKVIVVSGEAYNPERFRLRQDVAEVLLKPVSPRGLAALVETLANSAKISED